jgi:hypothetical protein
MGAKDRVETFVAFRLMTEFINDFNFQIEAASHYRDLVGDVARE